MRSRARNEQEKERMRLAILEAATEIILAEGYEKLSMRKIADAIGYTPTTLYLYYKDKAQIVGDIAEEVYGKILLHIKQVLDENRDATLQRQLELIFGAFVRTMTDNAEMGKAVIRSGTNAAFGPVGEADVSEEDGITLLQRLLGEGQRQGVLRKLDDGIAWMLITALLGFSMSAIENQLYTQTNWDEMVHTYTELLVNGLLSR